MIRGLNGVLQRVDELQRMLGESDPAAAGPANVAQSFPAALDRAVSAETQTSGGAGAYESLIQSAAQRYGVDGRLVRAVMKAESDFDPRCVSSAGAKGLMQLMPENCEDLGVSDPFDPAQNVDGGVRHLKQMLGDFGRLDLALAAYNAGPGAVRRYGGIPPYRETQAYVSRILQSLNDE